MIMNCCKRMYTPHLNAYLNDPYEQYFNYYQQRFAIINNLSVVSTKNKN